MVEQKKKMERRPLYRATVLCRGEYLESPWLESADCARACMIQKIERKIDMKDIWKNWDVGGEFHKIIMAIAIQDKPEPEPKSIDSLQCYINSSVSISKSEVISVDNKPLSVTVAVTVTVEPIPPPPPAKKKDDDDADKQSK